MTNEELDAARAEEARRIWLHSDNLQEITPAHIAARLGRTGWTPAPAIDPLLLEAREICAQRMDERGYREAAKQYRNGEHDDVGHVRDALAALKRGMEIAREQDKAEPVAPVPVDRAREVFDAMCLCTLPKQLEIIRTYGDERECAGIERAIEWAIGRGVLNSDAVFCARSYFFGGAGDE